jgi:hypothetical protein
LERVVETSSSPGEKNETKNPTTNAVGGGTKVMVQIGFLRDVNLSGIFDEDRKGS